MKKNKNMHCYLSLKTKNSFRNFIPAISLMILAAYMNMIFGCSYYKVNTLEPLSTESVIKQVENKAKYIIVHKGEKAWHLKEIIVNDSIQEMTGVIEKLPLNHLYYSTAKKGKRANLYRPVPKRRDNPIHEIHIYTSEFTTAEDSKITIPFSSINTVEIYDNHTGATALALLGGVAAVGAVVFAIILATKSSCPFVFTCNGDSFEFTGEMYGGAIYSSLERDDYMPLPGFKPVNGQYRLRISNELLERQYTNLARLIVIEHPDNATAILDKSGSVQTISSPEAPAEAISNNNKNYTSTILIKDSSAYLFNEESSDGKDLTSLVLSFKKQEGSKSAKLIINAKNSFWLDYVYGKFNEQFGTYFNTFSENQKKVPAKKNIQWSLDQNIPLSVFVETKSGWAFVDYLNLIGPLASRDIVVPINLANVVGEKVRVKLESGFMFWEIDYVAMDFSENIPVQMYNINPNSAIDETGNEVSDLLSSHDEKYLIQPEIGNVVTVDYSAIKSKTRNSQTVFLHSRGYYEYIRNYKNLPDINTLQSFKKKGSFTRFAKKYYDEYTNTKGIWASLFIQNNEN